MGRLDAPLVTATAASLALAATILLLPDAPWRAPLALLAGIWAPGYALLALLYPRGRLVALERHALACGAGLLLLPLLGLLVSETVGFRPATLAAAQLLVTLAAAAGSLARATGEPEPVARSPAPSRRAVLAVGAVALLAVGAVLVPTLVADRAVPYSLAFEPMELEHPRGANVTIVVVMRAEDVHIGGPLVVRWGDRTLLEEQVTLLPGAEARREVSITIDDAQLLSASWAGREVHATLRPEARR